jgi:glycosyltransferase involved in cell wall biosynthesis
MKITAVVRTHNRKNFLKECLSSISIQTHKNWEAIIFDDGGDESNYQIYRDFKSNHADKRIVYITSLMSLDLKKKSWIYQTSISEGDLIIRVDDDDIFHEDSFSYISKIYKTIPILDFSFGSSATFLDLEKDITNIYYNKFPSDHKTKSAWGPYVYPVEKHWMWFENYYSEEIAFTSIIHASRKNIMTIYHPYVMRKKSLTNLTDLQGPTFDFFDDLEFLGSLEYKGLNYSALNKILIFCRTHSQDRRMNNSGISGGTDLKKEIEKIRDLVDLIRPNNFLPSITPIPHEKISIEEAQSIFDVTIAKINLRVGEIFGNKKLG